MHNHYAPLIICSKKNSKNKGNRKHKLSPHSTSHLKSTKPCGESSIKGILNKILPENKGKLNMNTSESCAIVRSFSSRSVLSPTLLFSSEKSRNVENSFFNKNHEVPTSSSGLEIPNQCISKDILVNNLEEPSKIISMGKYDNCNINYPEKFIKILQNSNSASNSNSENLSFSSKKLPVVINSFNSTFELNSSCTNSSNELISRETLVDELEQLSNFSCTGNYGKHNVNTSQQFTNAVQKFNSNLNKVPDLPLPVLEKAVTAAVSRFDSNSEFLCSCSEKSVIADSNLNTAGESSGVGVVSTSNRYDVATYRSKAPFTSNIEKKDLTKNVFVPDDSFFFSETN